MNPARPIPACVYVITNMLDDMKYVGKTIDPELRWKQHQACVRQLLRSRARGSLDRGLHAAMARDGIHNFKFEIIEIWPSEKEAFAAEKRWIAELRSTVEGHGYNKNAGGYEGTDHVASCYETQKAVPCKKVRPTNPISCRTVVPRKPYKGVQPLREQRHLPDDEVTVWEIDSRGETGSHGRLLPLRRKTVQGSKGDAIGARLSWLGNLRQLWS